MNKLKAFIDSNRWEAGCDEAGRGCLSGPVVAAAVILNPKKRIKGLDDSKKLTEKQRFLLREEILEKAETYAIGIVSPQEIDVINILNASIKAMHLAVEQLSIEPAFLLIDGNRFKPFKQIPYECFVKGDGRFQSIAAASILAKTTRDLIMDELDLQFPAYKWKKNKGYPTMDHREAVRQFGPTEHHRMTFRLLPEDGEQLKLFQD